MKNQQKKVFALIDSCDEKNILLALQLIKKNPALTSAVEKRYLPLIQFFKGKSISSLKTLEKKILKIAQKKGITSSSFFLKYDIPTGLLKNIESLNWLKSNLSENQLPDWLLSLPKLSFFDIGLNNFEKIPEMVIDMKKLTGFSIHSNKIKEISPDIHKLTKLDYLRLDHNPLSSFPYETLKLKNLTYLNLANCNIEFIPDEIVKLKKLEVLVLSENKIKTINPIIKKLKKLKRLYLDKNEIRKVPIEIEEMKNLETFDIKKNPLRSKHRIMLYKERERFMLK